MSFWSDDYAAAARRFGEAVARLEARGVIVTTNRLTIEPTGPDGGALAIDIAKLGRQDAPQCLVHSSGLHGVEGFAGSAIQLAILDEIDEIPDDVSLVFVHTLNPYGMAWLRRVNESNVDLNRNMLRPGEAYSGEVEGYDALSPLINDETPPSKRRDGLLWRLLWHVWRHGFAATKQAFAGGQYERPRGLQFGGHRLEQGLALLLGWLETNMTAVRECVWIDVHTGLGRRGEDALLVDHPTESTTFSELLARYGERVTSLAPNDGVAYEIRGGVQAGVQARFPSIAWTSIAQEFGTVGPFTVVSALRAENRWTQWGSHQGADVLSHWSRQDLKGAFFLEDEAWKQTLLRRGRALYEDALADLTTRRPGTT